MVLTDVENLKQEEAKLYLATPAEEPLLRF